MIKLTFSFVNPRRENFFDKAFSFMKFKIILKEKD